MNFKIYHQLGHNYNWNLESMKEDGCGDGVIIAPRFMTKEYVENLDQRIKREAIFDPQFFLPDTPKGKLETYNFFPHIASEGFDTDDYPDTYASICAKCCLDFQLDSEFYRIVIPTRYFCGTPSDFITQQKKLFVEPFLDEIRKAGTSKPILLQLIVNELMFKDPDYIADILNWITSLEIHGVYLISESDSPSKQIKDSEFLLSLFDFIDALKSNDMEVVLGYLNTESILLSLANPDIVTVGSYENMRSFKIRTFEKLESPIQIGPNPRLYVSKLLQSIEYPYIGAIKRKYPNFEDIFDTNRHQAIMFSKTFKWHFTKPQLYKHHFLVITKQLKELSTVSGKDRYIAVRNMIDSAMKKYDELLNKGIVFDANSDGSHLPLWLTVANLYAANKGWR